MIELIKDELGEKIMTEFVGLRAKTYSYVIDDDSGDKKAKGRKRYVIISRLKFEECKNIYKIMKLC